jgi:hypothetical protein
VTCKTIYHAATGLADHLEYYVNHGLRLDSATRRPASKGDKDWYFYRLEEHGETREILATGDVCKDKADLLDRFGGGGSVTPEEAEIAMREIENLGGDVVSRGRKRTVGKKK